MILPLNASAGELSITSILRDRPHKKYVETFQKYCARSTMHMTGLGLDKAIERFDYYESPRLLLLRQKYSPSNVDFYSRLHRPIDKIFNAKGGSVNYLLPESQRKAFAQSLSDVYAGYSMRRWIETFWLPAYQYDPMGLILMEVGNEKTYPTYISSMAIWDVPKPIGRTFEYIVIKLDKKDRTSNLLQYQDTNPTATKAESGYYRVIDDAFDYTIKWDGGVATIIEDESYPNFYGKVPACTASNIWDNVKQFYISPDDTTLDIADQHLRNRSVLVMFELHHGFPLNWQYAGRCMKCSGTGKISADNCDSCNGTGKESKKDVSKLILLPFPKSKDDPIIDKPGGTVEAAIDSWQEMKLTIEQQYKEAHYATWGTNQIEDSNHQTATGRFIDVQPVNDKLGKFSDAAEWMETWITNNIGEFEYPNSYIGCEINYGRRYLVEPPDMIAEKLQNAVKGKMSYSYMKTLYFQWVDSEYSGDEMTRLRLTMEFKLDPSPFMTVLECKDAFANSEIDYYKKLYLGQFIETLPNNWYFINTFEKLEAQFTAWILAKMATMMPIESEKETKTKGNESKKEDESEDENESEDSDDDETETETE